ncbi:MULTISPECIES: hypothetical protein [Marinobacter]|uniref:Uncharacterized protein n=1 Tax=Marinobacter xestospongiae TaxID=994319 RepID=A0ABU3VT34_9GAMM|nr:MULTISPECIES: hypothetical protein [Marinobacter]MDV2077426.1 hypothetical protein [Marinobacter xestospongiae]UDL04252.1 hypothetical protein J2887_16330 [Marinobacter sp. CA1]
MAPTLLFANRTLLVCFLALVSTVMLAYPLAGALPMSAQIGAHIGTMVFAAGLKVAYVLRLVALKHLGRPIH